MTAVDVQHLGPFFRTASPNALLLLLLALQGISTSVRRVV